MKYFDFIVISNMGIKFTWIRIHLNAIIYLGVYNVIEFNKGILCQLLSFACTTVYSILWHWLSVILRVYLLK